MQDSVGTAEAGSRPSEALATACAANRLAGPLAHRAGLAGRQRADPLTLWAQASVGMLRRRRIGGVDLTQVTVIDRCGGLMGAKRPTAAPVSS